MKGNSKNLLVSFFTGMCMLLLLGIFTDSQASKKKSSDVNHSNAKSLVKQDFSANPVLLKTFKLEDNINGHVSELNFLFFSKDSRQLWSESADGNESTETQANAGKLKCWNSDDGFLFGQYNAGFTSDEPLKTMSLDGTFVAQTHDRSGSVYLYNKRKKYLPNDKKFKNGVHDGRYESVFDRCDFDYDEIKFDKVFKEKDIAPFSDSNYAQFSRNCYKFSIKNRYFVAAGCDKTLTVYDLQKKEKTYIVLKGKYHERDCAYLKEPDYRDKYSLCHCRCINAVDISADEAIAVSGDGHGYVSIYDLSRKNKISTTRVTQQSIETVALSNDKTMLAVGTNQGRVYLLNLKSRKKRLIWEAINFVRNKKQNIGYINICKFTPDDRGLGIGFSDGMVLISTEKIPAKTTFIDQNIEESWSANQNFGMLPDTKAIVFGVKFDTTKGIKHLDFSPNGKYFAYASESGTIKVGDLNSATVKYTIPRKSHSDVQQTVFTPDDKNLMITRLNGVLSNWNVASGELNYSKGGTQHWAVTIMDCLQTGNDSTIAGELSNAPFQRQENYFITCDKDTLKKWELGSGRLLMVVPFRGTNVKFSPDGNFLFAVIDSEIKGALKRIIQVYESRSLRKLHSIDVGDYLECDYAISKNGDYLAYTRQNEHVDIYNWKTGNLISTIKYEALVNYGFRSIAFSDDGMLVALGGFNSIILNRSVGRLVVDLYGGDVFAFSSDGKYVLRGYGNGVAINSVFNSSDSCTFALKEGTEVSSAAFSHDNTMVAVGFKTGETEIWKVK